ncbi:glutathione S-transferase family protein [Sphingopyxis sp. EG6]|uniref:glutathione S-transferase family protein n=1 Tax=Sphingopyxis sp. EG6 TaxID=1874061 RepID=UPI000DC63774|nr:glutathione S-transferase family protein [Sphingopyxis sp. EG6]BBB07005.1 glutathione S-transferase [Sphingopyxis sp. EG6]
MLILYAHPFSSYSWKAQIALDEKGIDYDYRSVDPEYPEHGEQLRALWPVGKFPLLVDGDRTLFETSIIIEYLDRVQPEPRLIPADPDAALRVRQMDRVFDLHVMAVMQEIVNDRIRGPEGHAPMIVDKARAALDTIYRWLDTQLAGGGWATLDGFTLADCAAAPSLFYADWVHEIPAELTNLRGYRARLLARPSVARAVDGARPYRHYFPGGAPDRD